MMLYSRMCDRSGVQRSTTSLKSTPYNVSKIQTTKFSYEYF